MSWEVAAVVCVAMICLTVMAAIMIVRGLIDDEHVSARKINRALADDRESLRADLLGSFKKEGRDG